MVSELSPAAFIRPRIIAAAFRWHGLLNFSDIQRESWSTNMIFSCSCTARRRLVGLTGAYFIETMVLAQGVEGMLQQL